MNLKLAQALQTLRRLPGEELPRLAADLLASGVDTEAVRELAGVEHATQRDTGELFERILRELGTTAMTVPEAAAIVARDLANKVVAGALAPREAAQRGSSFCPDAQYPHVLTRFLGFADDYECFPDAHARIDADVLLYSKRLLAGDIDGAA
jgi:hypothetical protein